MARLLRVEVSIAELAIIRVVTAMSRAVLDVLIVCFSVRERTIASVAVCHFLRGGSPKLKTLALQGKVDVVWILMRGMRGMRQE
jgi:hypothetical protein